MAIDIDHARRLFNSPDFRSAARDRLADRFNPDHAAGDPRHKRRQFRYEDGWFLASAAVHRDRTDDLTLYVTLGMANGPLVTLASDVFRMHTFVQ